MSKHPHKADSDPTPIASADVKVSRSYDFDRLNEIINHPEVRKTVADAADGVLDMTARIMDAKNVLLMGEGGHGACFLAPLMAGVWEVHTQVMPDHRGPWALGLARAVLNWMFINTDAYEVVTRVPESHKAAATLAVTAGMRREFVRPHGCKFNGEDLDVALFGLRIQDWLPRAKGLEEVGRDFHTFLNAEAARLNVTEPPHEDDPNHNQYVGASVAMVNAGQVMKGVMLYNRWAQMSRKPVVHLLGMNPVRIKMDLGVLTVRSPGVMEVVRP